MQLIHMMIRLFFICTLFLLNLVSLANTTISQKNWRWRSDNGNQTDASWVAGENTPIIIEDFNPLRIRVELDNNTGETKTLMPSLKYSRSTAGPWFAINTIVGARDFSLVNSSYLAHGENTSNQISNSSANDFVAGKIIQNNFEFTQELLSKTRTEFEWVIKPNLSLEPNTTYYFKTDAGDIQSYAQLTTSPSLPVHQKLVTNGGFEDNFSGWATNVLGTSKANFEIVTETVNVHQGRKALKVFVKDKGDYANVQLTQRNLSLDPKKVYLLRFWAYSDRRNSLIDVSLKGLTSNNSYRCQIYDRYQADKSVWQMYQYPFKVTEPTTTLELTFNSNGSFYLDDIEIISEDHQVIDVKSQYKWHHEREPYGWISGDNDNSVKLPDGSVAWIFSDAFIGPNDPHTNVISNLDKIVNNMVVLEKPGFPLKSINNQYKGNTQFSPNNGNVFWNSGGVVENNKLKILLVEVGSNANNDIEKRTFIGSLNLPDLNFSDLVRAPFYRTVAGANTAFQDLGYSYIYLDERPSTFEAYSRIARVPVGSLDASTPWEVYTNEGTWEVSNGNDSIMANAKRIISAQAGSVVKLGPNSYALSAVPHLSNEIAVWFSKKPEGPWTNKTIVYNFLPEEKILAYQGHIDKGSGENGIYTLSYSVYPFVDDNPVSMQLADKGTYIPYFVKANLVELSPYGAGTLPITLKEFTARAEGNKARIEWTSMSESENEKFEIEKSADGKAWFLLKTIKGNGNSKKPTTYTAFDYQPHPTNYYRLKQFDFNGNENDLGIRAVKFQLDRQSEFIKTYPNPVFDGDVHIIFPNIESHEGAAVELSNVEGKVIKTENIASKITSFTFTVPKNLPSGLYLLHIRSGKTAEVKKLIISN